MIVFCHYGDAPYLRHTLAAARRTNPDRAVVLLGDGANEATAARAGVRHAPFERYAYGEDWETFDRVFRPVQGRLHRQHRGGRDWLRFVFERWFFVRNLAESEGAAPFWHFDSDVLITLALAQFEGALAGVDCTAQCNGGCLNGYVAGPGVAASYVRHINALFERPAYLAAQQREFDEVNPSYAFTEMRAYEAWREETGVAVRPLTAPISGTAFDDGLCFSAGYETERLRSGQEVKRVHLGESGSFWCRHEASGRWDRLGALNFSWVPSYLVGFAADHLASAAPAARLPGPPPREGRTLGSVPVPFAERPQDWWIRAKGAVNRAIGRA